MDRLSKILTDGLAARAKTNRSIVAIAGFSLKLFWALSTHGAYFGFHLRNNLVGASCKQFSCKFPRSGAKMFKFIQGVFLTF